MAIWPFKTKGPIAPPPPVSDLPVGQARRCRNGHVSLPVCAICGDKDD